MKPRPRVVTIRIAKWNSFIPASSASGSSSGARMTMLGVVSITQPASTRMPIIIRIISQGASVTPLIPLTRVWGISRLARLCASGRDTAMIGTMTPHTRAELSSMRGMSPSVRRPWRRPMMTTTTTATDAASVGVKMPV